LGFRRRLTIILCKEIIVAKSKKVKTSVSDLLRKYMAKKGYFANANDDDDDDDDDDDEPSSY
jgi:regulator of RNase E activity RraB